MRWLREVAAQTVAIVAESRYTAPSGRPVAIADEVWAAVSGTRLYQVVPCFDVVVFAIRDRTGEGATYRVFVDTFTPGRTARA